MTRPLRAASFRGAPFGVTGSDSELGKRTAHHEYPQKNKGWVEELGKLDASLRVEAFVVGPDYAAARDKLLDACHKPGAGDLVHPHLGRRRVVCVGVSVREASDAGGMATFQISFLEADDALYPQAATDDLAAVDEAADFSLEAILEDALGEIDLSGASQVIESVTAVVDQALDAVAYVRGLARGDWRSMLRFVPGLSHLYGLGTTLFSLVDLRFLVSADAGHLLAAGATAFIDPAGTMARVAGQVRALTPLAGSPDAALAAQRRLWGFGGTAGLAQPADVPAALLTLPAIDPITLGRARTKANQAAIAGLIARTALVEAARVATFTTPASYDDAVALRDEIADAFDAHLDVASDSVFRRLSALRATTLRAITTRSVDLPRLRRVTPAVTLPALVLAYDIHGDAGLADEILSRNKIPHPGFVAGGQALEVLRHG